MVGRQRMMNYKGGGSGRDLFWRAIPAPTCRNQKNP